MRRWWVMTPRSLSEEYCQVLLDQALPLPAEEAMVGAREARRLDPEYRKALIRAINRTEPLWHDLACIVDDLFQTANLQVFGFDLGYCREIQVIEYPKGGHYQWHADCQWITGSPSQRKLSLVIPLNEPAEYEGGALELAEKPLPDAKQLQRVGTALVIPSFLQKRFHPVTQGTRYVLSAWCEGPAFR